MSSSHGKAPIGCLISLGIFGLICGYMYWTRAAYVLEEARLLQCVNSFRQIHLSLENYEATNKTLPPRVFRDPEGNPLYSWRLAAMRHNYYDRDFSKILDLNLPWNSPENRDSIVFRFEWPNCPNLEEKESHFNANYYAVTAPNSVWENHPYKLADIPDGPENTLLLIELNLPGIHWMEPKDVSLEELLTMLKERGELPSLHKEGVMMCFADGTVYRVPNKKISRLFLKRIVSIDGGGTPIFIGESYNLTKRFQRK